MTMIEDATLSIDIQGYWHSGTGRGSGSYLDAIVDTSHDGLPYLSGRHLKGLLRDAVHKAETWGQLKNFPLPPQGQSVTEVLFGARFADPETRVPRDETTQGMLRIGDARLPETIRRWLSQPAERQNYARYLQRTISSTAINAATGVAKERSLRGIQVTIPLELQATISFGDPTRAAKNQVEPQSPSDRQIHDRWPDILEHCLPLIRAVGAQRGRGLGRASLKLSREGRS
ncbi:MAG: RAMP superfamily CRISPR-associated protein [Gammaproteobacteria bacterium]